MKECNCCGIILDKFSNMGNRTDALCPSCGTLERHRAMWMYMSNIKTDGKKILHIAPEKIFFEKYMNDPNTEYYPGALNGKGQILAIDITKIDFSDKYFDIIICSHVLEHVIEDIKALSEFKRVLKDDGFALILVPINKSLKVTYEDINITSPQDRLKYFGQADHVRIYGLDFFNRVDNVGFKLEKITYLEDKYKKYGFKDTELYILKK